MQKILNPQFFIGNRIKLREVVSYDTPIIIPANGQLQRTADSTYPFTQDSNFWYLTGLAIADLILVIDSEGEFLIRPGRSETRNIFDGTVTDETITRISGIKEILGEREGWRRLKNAMETARKLSMPYAPKRYIKHFGMYTNPSKKLLVERLRRAVPSIEFSDTRPALSALRSVKQPLEINCIETAVAITKSTIEDIVTGSGFANMRNEYELEAVITHGFRHRGASGHAYEPIVACGENATTLHYIENSSRLQADKYIVIDVGAEVEHYAADITRTLIQDHPSPRQLAIYDAVQSVQSEEINLMKPGVPMKEIEHATEKIMGRHLKALGLVTNADDRQGIRRYFPHASSHFLGLDVHDVGDYSEPLQENMVLTCEPGIYIPEEEIGVRIEDDILITESGCRVI